MNYSEEEAFIRREEGTARVIEVRGMWNALTPVDGDSGYGLRIGKGSPSTYMHHVGRYVSAVLI